MSFTADASVVIRWLIPGEENEEQALKLRNDYAKGSVELNAPTLLDYEVLNGLWKAVERNNVGAEDASSMLEAFEKIKPRNLILNLEDSKKALEIAIADHVSFYDASYITTAIKTNSTLITADQSLLNAAKKHVKTIHLKGY
ncbi:MAG: type II toxin-antitoxin system VapC family toxin [Candidatus Bathyarchaeia archaeon]